MCELQQENDRLRAELAQLRQFQEPLQKRNLWLTTIAEVSNLLLRSRDYQSVLPEVVRLLGEAVGSDRCGIGQNLIHPILDKPAIRIAPEWEWCKNEVLPSEEFSPHSDRLFLREIDAPYIDLKLSQGKVINCFVADLPEPDRSLLASQGNVAELFVPIWVNHENWGYINFDNCSNQQLYDEAEIAILEIAANSIAAAIERQAKEQALQAAQQERNRLLSTVAQISNQLLRSRDYRSFLPEVVRLLGEVVGSDRCCISGDTAESTAEHIVVEILTEWCRTGILGTLDSNPEMKYWMLRENFAVIRERLYQGETTNFLIADLPEPTRSIFTAQGNTSMLVVPIMVQGVHWGEIGFDNCGEPRLYDEAEIAILKIAADSIAAAIERQTKDDELRKSEALYRSLFEISNEGIWRWAVDQPLPMQLSIEEQVQFVYQHLYFAQSNDAFAQMYGFDRAEAIVGLRLSDAFVADSDKNLAFIRAWIESGYSMQSLETEEISATGEKRHFLNSIISFIENDRVTGGWGTQIDITELRAAQSALLQAEQAKSQELESLNAELQQTLDDLAKSEQRFRVLFEMSSEGFYYVEAEPPIPIDLSIEEQCKLFHHNLKVVEANPAFISMYGANSFEEIAGMGNSDCHIENSETNRAFIRTLIESNYRGSNIETEEVDRHGRSRYFLNNCFGTIEDNYFIGGWGTQLDITELRLAQQALLQAEQNRVAELAKTNQALKNSLDRLAANPDLNSFLGQVLLEITQQLQIDLGYLFFYHSAEQTLELHILVTPEHTQFKSELEENHPFSKLFTLEELPIWNTLLQTRKPFVITRDNAAQSVFQGTLEWQEREADHQSGINLLLTLKEEPIGLLSLVSTKDNFTPEDLELAQALAQQATLAIQLTRLAEEAKQSALFEERNRMASEIHDVLAQAFTGISVQLELAQYLIHQNPTEVEQILDRISKLAQTGLTEARRSVWSIYPTDEDYADLAQKLSDCLQHLTNGTSLQTDILLSGEVYPLSAFVGKNLLRIGQEAITNSLKHAHATRLWVELLYTPHQITLRVGDDGCGFSPHNQTEGFGLIGISERVDRIQGHLKITTQVNEGTEIFVQVQT
jgi:signal transduction histidine kinase/PAS domain-containing protein